MAIPRNAPPDVAGQLSVVGMPSVAGLDIEEAKRRLQNAGATVLIAQCSSKKGVPDADCVRVVRERVRNDPQTGMLIVELLVSAFKTKLSAE